MSRPLPATVLARYASYSSPRSGGTLPCKMSAILHPWASDRVMPWDSYTRMALSDSVMRSTFPAGTLSGAPKIRAMQIISELEKEKRGSYGGAVAYYSFDGNVDSCITIRTALIKDGKVYVQAGAGIVADSEPEKEYTETVNKAKGMMKAVDMAEEGLD